MLRIDFESGDLSRRQITYNLPGLSFREYLYFEDIIETKALNLTDLIKDHKAIAEDIKVTGKGTRKGYKLA